MKESQRQILVTVWGLVRLLGGSLGSSHSESPAWKYFASLTLSGQLRRGEARVLPGLTVTCYWVAPLWPPRTGQYHHQPRDIQKYQSIQFTASWDRHQSGIITRQDQSKQTFFTTKKKQVFPRNSSQSLGWTWLVQYYETSCDEEKINSTPLSWLNISDCFPEEKELEESPGSQSSGVQVDPSPWLPDHPVQLPVSRILLL